MCAADAVETVNAAGDGAEMMMLGGSVVALGDALSAAGYDAESCTIDAAGARPVA